jgi:hypothetical protein
VLYGYASRNPEHLFLLDVMRAVSIAIRSHLVYSSAGASVSFSGSSIASALVLVSEPCVQLGDALVVLRLEAVDSHQGGRALVQLYEVARLKARAVCGCVWVEGE